VTNRDVKLPVIVVMNNLHSGGAEKTCLELVNALADRCDFTVISLLSGGPAAAELRAAGAEVVLLEAAGPFRMWRAAWRLARLMGRLRPVAVVTLLYFADLIGGLFARWFAPRAHVYWNVRNNVLAREQTSAGSFVAARIAARLSRFLPHTVVYCSATARAQHETLGYEPKNAAVVENSMAAVPFRFSAEARVRLREGLARDNECVYLFVGRFDPVKRVDVFLDACDALLARGDLPVRFLLAGRGMEPSNDWLRHRLERSRAPARFATLGYVTDRQALYSGADCLVVTSETEGSPNVLYEAQATQLLAIVLATQGTEHLQGAGIVRLATRDLEPMVDAMWGVLTSSRPPRGTGAQPVSEHPLAAYLRAALPRS
jgi:glycosyltransferase involved in cell wall biosynthesis